MVTLLDPKPPFASSFCNSTNHSFEEKVREIKEKKNKERERERERERDLRGTNMPTTMNNIQVEDQIVLYSQLYPAVYTQMVPQQGLYFNQKQKVLSRLYIYLYLLYICVQYHHHHLS